MGASCTKLLSLSPGLEAVDSAQTTHTDVSKPTESETEIELVEVVTEMSTEDLQEFACSVSVPKQNKKSKKKKGSQKATGGEATPVQPNRVDTPQLSKLAFEFHSFYQFVSQPVS